MAAFQSGLFEVGAMRPDRPCVKVAKLCFILSMSLMRGTKEWVQCRAKGLEKSARTYDQPVIITLGHREPL